MNKIVQLMRDNALRPKVANILNVAGDSADIYIYDMISADWGVSAMSVIQAIQQAGNVKTLNVHINSPGGDVFEGRAIMAALSSFNGKTVAIIDALCASAATSIALACSEVQMAEGALFMIHNASTFAWGDKTALRDTADLLQKIDGIIINDYAVKTGKTADEIAAMMDAETWMDAKEALDAGFIDSICEKPKATNAWNLSAFDKAPQQRIPEPEPEPVPEPSMTQANTNQLRLSTLL